MLRCAITEGAASGFVNSTEIERLERQVLRWAAEGIDFIQLREKNVDAGALFVLAEATMRVLDNVRCSTKLLVNSRADVAIAARAHGVHLRSHPDELTPLQVRAVYAHAQLPVPVVSVSCHTLEEVQRACDNEADFILFGPVFEKRIGDRLISTGAGLAALSAACRRAGPVPVLALGGVTLQKANALIAAGATGIAGIRTFL